MRNIDRRIQFSAIQVHWSRQHRVFTASSEQFPGVVHRDESSLAALDGFIEQVTKIMREPMELA